MPKPTFVEGLEALAALREPILRRRYQGVPDDAEGQDKASDVKAYRAQSGPGGITDRRDGKPGRDGGSLRTVSE